MTPTKRRKVARVAASRLGSRGYSTSARHFPKHLLRKSGAGPLPFRNSTADRAAAAADADDDFDPQVDLPSIPVHEKHLSVTNKF